MKFGLSRTLLAIMAHPLHYFSLRYHGVLVTLLLQMFFVTPITGRVADSDDIAKQELRHSTDKDGDINSTNNNHNIDRSHRYVTGTVLSRQGRVSTDPNDADDATGRGMTSRVTGSDKEDDLTSSSSVMFVTADAYLVTKLKLYATFNISFRVRTTQPSGLIFYSGSLDSSSSGSTSSGKDFMALELDGSGQVRYVFDVGSGPRILQATGSSNARPINDNHWHDVSVARSTVNRHVMRVNGKSVADVLPDSRSVYYDIPDDLYVGGLPSTAFGSIAKQIRSREGFQGCLSEMSLDGESWSLSTGWAHIPDDHQGFIKEGCVGPSVDCSSSVCRNSGLCVQQWNDLSCNCDMTSFTGPTCDEDGISYVFGHVGGLVGLTLTDADVVDRRADQLALGFVTRQPHSTLLRVSSSTSNDFIEVQLADGLVSVVYNMGKVTHTITSRVARQLDDGRYHVIRFTRSGANSTLRVDNQRGQSKQPSGRQLTTFNQQSSIEVGGRRDTVGKLLRPFHGLIAGVWLNGLRVFDFVADRDFRSTINGDVQLNVEPLKSYKLRDPLPKVANVSSTDDVIGKTITHKLTTIGQRSDSGSNPYQSSTIAVHLGAVENDNSQAERAPSCRHDSNNDDDDNSDCNSSIPVLVNSDNLSENNLPSEHVPMSTAQPTQHLCPGDDEEDCNDEDDEEDDDVSSGDNDDTISEPGARRETPERPPEPTAWNPSSAQSPKNASATMVTNFARRIKSSPTPLAQAISPSGDSKREMYYQPGLGQAGLSPAVSYNWVVGGDGEEEAGEEGSQSALGRYQSTTTERANRPPGPSVPTPLRPQLVGSVEKTGHREELPERGSPLPVNYTDFRFFFTSPSTMLSTNISLIVGIVAGILILIVVLVSFLYQRWRRRRRGHRCLDGGHVYKFDTTDNLAFDPSGIERRPRRVSGASQVHKGATAPACSAGMASSCRGKNKRNIREWYV